jgi:hypothetical protein
MVINDIYELNVCKVSLEMFLKHLSSSCTNQLCAAALKDLKKCTQSLLNEICCTSSIAILSTAETYVLKKALQRTADEKDNFLHKIYDKEHYKSAVQYYQSEVVYLKKLIEKINDMEQLLYYNRTHHPDKVEQLKSIFQVFTLETHITPSLAL